MFHSHARVRTYIPVRNSYPFGLPVRQQSVDLVIQVVPLHTPPVFFMYHRAVCCEEQEIGGFPTK